MKEKPHGHLSQWRKTCDKIQHTFMIKTLNKREQKETTYLHIIKATYEKPTANSILKDQEQRQDAHFHHFYSI